MVSSTAPTLRLASARAALAWLCVAGASACGDDAGGERAQDVTTEVSPDIATVVKVRFRTDDATLSRVEYGLDGFDRSTPLSSEPSQDHLVTLLGLKPDTEYRYRIVVSDGSGESAGEARTLRSGPLPASMPRLTLEGSGHDALTIVPVLGMTTAVTVIDPDGDIVWYHSDDRELDFYRARLSVDGESLLYNAASVSGDPADDSEIVRVALDGSWSDSIPVPLLAHDFVEHPDGTLGAIVVEYREHEGVELRGDKIVEIDPEGSIETVWSAWDCFDPAEVTGDEIDHGWTFANALDYDPDEGAYYLGMRNFSSIAKIDRATGACEWVLGAYGSTLDFAPGSGRFLHQHQFELRGDRLMVMDNEGPQGNESRVIEYQLDLEAGLATEVWSYVADPSVYTFVLGEPSRLPGGDVFINWSAAGQLERVSPEGESRWKLNTRAGFVFGFHTLASSLYPEGRP